MGFLDQLEHWCFTKGSKADYEMMKAGLRKKFGGKPGIGDVIWALMNDGVRQLGEDHNRQIQQVQNLFDGKVPQGMSATTAKEFLKDLRQLMREFRQFEGDTE